MSEYHLERLREAMLPDPSEWRFTGGIRDSGTPDGSACACGHRIRYEFFIERARDRARLSIGSTCIDNSVPFLIAAGATGLAEELQHANKEHKRKIEKERREARARQELPTVTEDLWSLIRWFTRAKHAHQQRASERDGVHVFWPDDIAETPRMPEASSTPARLASAIRRRYLPNFLKALRFLHETEGEERVLPELPQDLRLRNTVGEAVREHAARCDTEYGPACRFAQRAFRGHWDEALAVPVPHGAKRRSGYASSRTSVRRPREMAPGSEDRPTGQPNPLLPAALDRTFAGDEDAARRWQVFQDAKRRRSRSGSS